MNTDPRGTQDEFAALANPGQALTMVRELLARYLEADLSDIQPGARLFELPEVDSLKLMVAWLRFEREFGVSFELNEDAVTMTVAELADILARAARGS